MIDWFLSLPTELGLLFSVLTGAFLGVICLWFKKFEFQIQLRFWASLSNY